jgi:hypothetical protein
MPIDFSILNALAVEIGENRLLEMAKAYVAYVEDKRAGVSPAHWKNIAPGAPRKVATFQDDYNLEIDPLAKHLDFLELSQTSPSGR